MSHLPNAKKTLLKVIGISSVATLALFIGVNIISNKIISNKPKPSSIKVQVSLVQVGMVEDSAEFIASVNSRRLTTLQPPIKGQIIRIFVKVGDIVASGQTIMELVPTKQEKQFQRFKISAPHPGIVDDIPVKEGELVNGSTELTKIIQNQPLEVNIFVPTQQAFKLRKGMLVEVMDSQDRSLGITKVFFISPSVDNNSQTVLAKTLFDNSKGELRTGQSVRVRVIWERRPGIEIPVTAVSRISGETFVFTPQTPENSKPGVPNLVAQQKRVKLGGIEGENYQVLEGLKAGEKIIVSSILNLTNGAPITPVSEETGGQKP